MKRIFCSGMIKYTLVCLSVMCSFTAGAQSITGKWKLTDAKETVTDKASGKTQDLGAQIKPFLNMMQQTITFNADHSYAFSQNMTGSKKALEGSGTYNVSGNQLKLDKAKSNMPDIDKKYSAGNTIQLPPTATIVSQTSTTLVLRYGMETTDNGKTFVMNIEDTFTKQ